MVNDEMKKNKPILLIPVELQVRELEPKLLLACMAARRGYQSVIGPRREMHFQLPHFPQSIYLSKSTTNASNNVFKHLQRLGGKVVAWDEEALVSPPPQLYFRHRLSSTAIHYVSHLFAWGEANADLWRRYDHLPDGIPIHITGNPRGDLLRKELRGYYAQNVKTLRRTYGDFVLINTNFNLINAYHPDMCLVMPGPNPGDAPVLTRRSISLGLDQSYAQDFTEYKLAILQDFKGMVKALDQAFPDHTVVVRPHPAENPDVYHQLAAECQKVAVTNKGNVVPWLLASKALIHNGCTTGIEAYALDIPAVAYRARTNAQFDRDFHDLPNQLSHECFNIEELKTVLGEIIEGRRGVADSHEQRALMRHHLAAQSGAMACERMIDVLDAIAEDMANSPRPAAGDRLRSWIWAHKRRVKKHLRARRKNMSHNRADFLRHRYPEISLENVRTRVARFQKLLGFKQELMVKQFAGHFFRICG